jgi:hypothetical protein
MSKEMQEIHAYLRDHDLVKTLGFMRGLDISVQRGCRGVDERGDTYIRLFIEENTNMEYILRHEIVKMVTAV